MPRLWYELDERSEATSQSINRPYRLISGFPPAPPRTRLPNIDHTGRPLRGVVAPTAAPVQGVYR